MNKRTRRSRLSLWLTLLWVATIQPLLAHDPGLSTATITIRPEKVRVVLVFAIADARVIAGSAAAPGRKPDTNRLAEELTPIIGQSIELTLDGNRVSAAEVRCLSDDSNVTLELDFHSRPFTKISFQSNWISRMARGHRQFVSIQDSEGVWLASGLLGADSNGCAAEIHADSDSSGTKPGSFRDFVVMGVKHIWTGYDHLLFLFGLLAVTRNLRAVLQIITCFTVAHSMTLAIATLNLLQISGKVVEPLIAASIVFVGVENVLCSGEPKGRWLLTFGFGLIHGFGFASALREAGVGTTAAGVAVPLFSFNFGIELGQVAIAAAALPVIWKLKTQRAIASRWIAASSALVSVLGAYWLIERVLS